MKKAKIFIIIFLVVLLGLLVTGGILAWPLIVKLTTPWLALLEPHQVKVFSGVFIALSVYVGFRRWKLWVKAIVLMFTLSAISLTCNIGLIELLSNRFYLAGFVFSAVITFFMYMAREDQKKNNKLPIAGTLSELENFSGTVKGCSGYFFNFRGQRVNIENKVMLQKVGKNVSVSFLEEGMSLKGNDGSRSSNSSESDIEGEFILSLGRYGDYVVKNARLFEINEADGVLNTIRFKV